ncbi:MAG TPA: hypothetical protein VJ436_09310 [Anaerolineales bacterium]|nr:hypothetical protein [Anaerolineales bacterium]
MDVVDEYIRQGIQKSLGRCHSPVAGRRRLMHAATYLKQGTERTLFHLVLDALVKGRPLELPEGFNISAYQENRLFPPIFVFFFLRPV